MLTSDFEYELPPELIAQKPLPERTASRMMVIRRASGTIEHDRVSRLSNYLAEGDLLVLNNTRVVPARMFGRRQDTGGQVELLLLEELAEGVWESFYRASRRAKAGIRVQLANGRLEGEIAEVLEGGRILVHLSGDRPVLEVLGEFGVPPVPPYIKRPAGEEGASLTQLDRERYQTVYAAEPGAVAAPTAGLHFSTGMLRELERKGVRRAELTLHVGPGTFIPVKTEHPEEHVMEAERYEMRDDTANAINRARRTGRRVVAVGSTCVRTLEAMADDGGLIAPGAGRTALFIRPPYEFRAVDAVLTNFHLPRSTLIMMVAAFAGRDLVLRSYREVIAQKYRFYSYGDCMLIL